MVESGQTKVIVIAGFLGAGKTTLIESILKAPSLDKKVAVI
jgi:G3E family GTPase